MEQLHECIVKLQSYFSDMNSQLEQPIEQIFLELQMLFENSDYGEMGWYYDQLREFWQQNRRKGNTQHIQHARQQLQQIIEKFNKLSDCGNVDVVSQNISLKQEIEMLKMQLDTKQRKEMQDQKDVQHFQRASEEIQNLKRTIRNLQKDQKMLQEKSKEESKRFKEKVEYLKKNQPSKPFEVKQLEEENAKLKQMNFDLISEMQSLKEQLTTKDFLIQDTRELVRLKEEVTKLHNENKQLEDQIQQLYDKLDLSKQNNLENVMNQMESQMKLLNVELKKAQEEIKVQQKKIDQLKYQNQKFTDKSLEPLGIRCLPELKGIQSHFHVIMHLLEVIQPFSQILIVTNKVSQIILKFISYIRKETESVTAQSANTLFETLGVDFQNDNKANDLLFQIIDHLSKAIPKKDAQKSQIATIIQTDDSPIYDMFFFLQRVFPMDLEIQRTEVPLINSIKHIRHLDNIIQPAMELQEYLKNLVKIEGQENMIDDKESDFNFLIFPNYLVLNVCELSLQKADIKINTKLPSSCLNQAINDFEYQLLAIIHCNEISQYSISLCKNNIWVQLQQDQVSSILLNDLLTFKQPYNDKEMLIYKRNK